MSTKQRINAEQSNPAFEQDDNRLKDTGNETDTERIVSPMEVEASSENKETSKGGRCADVVYFKIPKMGWLLIFCQLIYAFAFFGIRSLFTIYLNKEIGLSRDTSTMVYHLQPIIQCAASFAGAVIADNYLGRLNTILIFGIFQIAGFVLFPLSSLSTNLIFVLGSFVVLYLGKGSCMTPYSPFTGDQMPADPPVILEAFYSLIYFSNNMGAILGTFVTPILSEMKCRNRESCYPLAFGICSILFLVFVASFLSGIPWYVRKPRHGKALSRLFLCLWSALNNWRLNRKTSNAQPTFLDYADRERYPPEFLAEVRQALKVITFLIPFPVFWSLFEQQGSRWPLQGLDMEKSILSAAQMQLLNPLLVCILIPLFNNVVYPILDKLRLLRSQISRMLIGYLFVAASFAASGFVQIQIDQGRPATIPAGQTRLQFVNFASCPVSIQSAVERIDLSTTAWGRMSSSKLYPTSRTPVEMRLKSQCPFSPSELTLNASLPTQQSALTMAVMSTAKGGGAGLDLVAFPVDRTVTGTNGNVRVLGDFRNFPGNITVSAIDEATGLTVPLLSESTMTEVYLVASNYTNLPGGLHKIVLQLDNATKTTHLGDLLIDEAETLSLVILSDAAGGNGSYQMATVIEARTKLVNILYQIPQYFLVTTGEIFLSVTAMVFIYTEAPASMKTLINFHFLLTIVGGNLIVVFTASVPHTSSAMWEYFIFGIVCALAGVANLIIYKLLGMRSYNPVQDTHNQ